MMHASPRSPIMNYNNKNNHGASSKAALASSAPLFTTTPHHEGLKVQVCAGNRRRPPPTTTTTTTTSVRSVESYTTRATARKKTIGDNNNNNKYIKRRRQRRDRLHRALVLLVGAILLWIYTTMYSGNNEHEKEKKEPLPAAFHGEKAQAAPKRHHPADSPELAELREKHRQRKQARQAEFEERRHRNHDEEEERRKRNHPKEQHEKGDEHDDNDSSKDGPQHKGLLGGIFSHQKTKREIELEAQFKEFQAALEDLDVAIVENRHGGVRWVRTDLLPSLSKNEPKPLLDLTLAANKKEKLKSHFAARLFSFGAGSDREHKVFFMSHRKKSKYLLQRGALRLRTNNVWKKNDSNSDNNNNRPKGMVWEEEYQEHLANNQKDQETETPPVHGPKVVDFTKHSYHYPTLLMEPPSTLGDYPKLTSMKDIMTQWPQDDIDHPPSPFQEDLLHFDYTDPDQVEAAKRFRDAKLPFKLVNVPEVIAAGETWTDEYLEIGFDEDASRAERPYPVARGSCQESSDNFFAFFSTPSWTVDLMGIPPTRNNDWDYATWKEHANYADETSLSPYQPHFYWQAGVDREERYLPENRWCFISRDLPSFSSTEENMFVFEPESQKGIQCRFGERGVTAATHFDAGRNMIAMIKGAKRYILSPPRECKRLGIVTTRGQSTFRHSMLNFGHMPLLEKAFTTDNNDDVMESPMPQEEREWLERAGEAGAVETVLKAGEVLYIPSHWFHYISSLQRSAQCNVRSGIDLEGDAHFGGKEDVTMGCVV